jgi:hypothetical protein
MEHIERSLPGEPMVKRTNAQGRDVIAGSSSPPPEPGFERPLQGRREFLQATGVLTGVLAAGSPWALLAPSRAWAVDLTALTSAEGTALMAATRTIAPHDKLEDAAYALVVHAIDAAAAKPTPFFQSVRAQTLQILYATPMAAKLFGYEGEAFSKGGYLTRGFNDLRWLPEVPLQDSGPVPGAG